MGTGVAGASAARWLRSQGSLLHCLDDKPQEMWDKAFLSWCGRNNVDKCVCSGDRAAALIREMDLVVVSPGIPPKHPLIEEARRHGVAVVGELYLAASLWKGPLIGITGTNGKTTTTLLSCHLLKSAGIEAVSAGNISPPLFDLIDRNGSDICAVLEVSSFQLEHFPDQPPLYIKRPMFRTAVCLNVAPDHLDRHGSMENYIRAKERLFLFQSRDCCAVLGDGAESFRTVAQPVFLRDMVVDTSRKRLSITVEDRKEILDISAYAAAGKHNLGNLAAAFTIACGLGASAESMARGLSGFSLPSHRLEPVGSWEGVRFVDDSKATNVHAVINGLNAITGNIVLIAGGRAKGEDFSSLAKQLSALRNGNGPRVRGLILIGEAAGELDGALGRFFHNRFVVRGASGQEVMDKAVARAFSVAKQGDTVVLSPACASFDLFSGYRERGEAFKRAISRMIKGSA